jgi:putative DNA primase/helicase
MSRASTVTTSGGLDAPHFRSDIGNADRLVARLGDRILFVPGVGWVERHVNRYVTGEAAIREAARELAVEMFDAASSVPRGEDRKALEKHAQYSASRRGLDNAVAMAARDRRTVRDIDTFDADPRLLNVTNGVIVLGRSRRFRRHRKTDRFMQVAGVRFDDAAKCPRWIVFLSEIFGGNTDAIRFLRAWFCLSLTGLMHEQAMVFHYGPGANGKSVVAHILQALAGTYSRVIDASTLQPRRSHGPSEDIARVVGARVVVVNELPSRMRINEPLLKSLVGGDVLAARNLYRKTFQFRPQTKINIVGNHLPDIRDHSYGMWRRVRVLEYPVTIPDDDRDPAARGQAHARATRNPQLGPGGVAEPRARRSAVAAFGGRCDRPVP